MGKKWEWDKDFVTMTSRDIAYTWGWETSKNCLNILIVSSFSMFRQHGFLFLNGVELLRKSRSSIKANIHDLSLFPGYKMRLSMESLLTLEVENQHAVTHERHLHCTNMPSCFAHQLKKQWKGFLSGQQRATHIQIHITNCQHHLNAVSLLASKFQSQGDNQKRVSWNEGVH